MSQLPQTNAKLVSVSRESGTGAFSEDYDRPASVMTVVWQGGIDAYIQRKMVSSFNQNGELRRVMQVTLFVDADIPITLEPGDTVTYKAGNPNSAQTLAGRVQDITDPAYMPTLPDYFKCALEDTDVP